MDEKIYSYLDRIATSLEKIAQALSYNQDNLVSEDKESTVRHIDSPVTDCSKENDKAFEHTRENDLLEYSDDEYDNIVSHLDTCGITIKNICKNECASEALKSLSLFMGERYDDISDVYKRIKARLGDGKAFSMTLKNKKQEEISGSCQFCNMLYRIAFLADYKYKKSPAYQLFARPNRDPKAINFLTGHWFELYVTTILENEINSIKSRSSENIKWAFMSNPQIKLPNGDDFELDILFSVNGDIYWYEVKTGTYQDYIGKYSKMSDMLNLDEEHCFLVLMNTTTDDCSRLSKVFNMNVVSLNDIKNVIEETLSKYKRIIE